jgi:hypothetical protein
MILLKVLVGILFQILFFGALLILPSQGANWFEDTSSWLITLALQFRMEFFRLIIIQKAWRQEWLLAHRNNP